MMNVEQACESFRALLLQQLNRAENLSGENVDYTQKSVITIEIVRGPGVLVADNSPERIPVQEGDIVTFRQSELSAEVLGLDHFMCPKCRVLRQWVFRLHREQVLRHHLPHPKNK